MPYKIFVAGKTFDCDARVVTWHESGWDHTKEGCVSFGFLIAPDVRRLKAKLAERGVTAD